MSARPDGVHLDVRSLPGDGTTVELASVSGRGRYLGGSLGGAHAVGPSVIDTVAPGQVLVRCYPDRGPRHLQSAADGLESVVLEVIDPNTNWTPIPDLNCPGPLAHAVYDYSDAPDEAGPQPADAAAADLDRSPEDVETYGFGDGRHRWAGVRKDGALATIAPSSSTVTVGASPAQMAATASREVTGRHPQEQPLDRPWPGSDQVSPSGRRR